MTTAEVAEHLRITERSVKRLIGSGKLKGTRYGRAIRILPEDFEIFRREGTCKTKKIGQAGSSSKPEARDESNTSAGSTKPLDRRMAFQLALQTSKRRGGSYTSTPSLKSGQQPKTTSS
jgi:excisionase family DNA binding protein